MRFVVTAEWRENHLLRLILAGFLVFVALLWVTNGLLFFSQMSLTPASVVQFYRGSEEAFTQPRSFKVLLEISHFHLFAMGILVLTMTHLVLFAPIGIQAKAWLILVSFGSALADEAAGWLVRFVDPGFAWLKLAGFLLLQTSLALMLVIVAWSVWATPPNGYRGNGSRAGPGRDV
jgi:hypothetical protein